MAQEMFFFRILIYYNHFVERRKIHRLTSWHHFVFCQRRISFALRSASYDRTKICLETNEKRKYKCLNFMLPLKQYDFLFDVAPKNGKLWIAQHWQTHMWFSDSSSLVCSAVQLEQCGVGCPNRCTIWYFFSLLRQKEMRFGWRKKDILFLDSDKAHVIHFSTSNWVEREREKNPMQNCWICWQRIFATFSSVSFLAFACCEQKH